MLKHILQTPFLKLKGVVGVKGRMEKEYLDIIKENGISYLELEAKPTIEQLGMFSADVDFILMYKFEYILPKAFIEKNTVFNFHGGDLKTNRGAHAVVWSVLNCDERTCLSLYKLTGGIDEGEIVGQWWVELEEEETVDSLNNKLGAGIPTLLLDLKECLLGNKEYTVCMGGDYIRKVNEMDYTLDLEKDSIRKIKAKIRSQYNYAGAICIWQGDAKRVKSYSYSKGNHGARKIEEIEDGLLLSDNGECLKICFLR